MTNDRPTGPEDPPLQGPHPLRVIDPEAARQSNLHDVPADRAWFRDNLGASHRYREATPRERAAYGFPRGTVVVVRVHRGELFYFFAAHLPEIDPRQTADRRPTGNALPSRRPGPFKRGERRGR